MVDTLKKILIHGIKKEYFYAQHVLPIARDFYSKNKG